MKFREFLKEIPWLPFSALVFYLVVVALWTQGILPSPSEIFGFLEIMYAKYGLYAMFVSLFLEGLVYFGLYFPGSLIIFIALLLSDGSFGSFLNMVIVGASALTLAAGIDYFLGRNLRPKTTQFEEKRKQIASKGLFLALLHPNPLAFYFFNAGMRKQSSWKIAVVPFFIFVYGFALAYFLYSFKGVLIGSLDAPYIFALIILAWLILAFVVGRKSKKEILSDIIKNP